MPVTPFHFGPGAMVHAVAPKHVSFLAFCIANVLMDLEPLYYIVTHQYPLHRFFHTYIGATLVLFATSAIFLLALKLAAVVPLADLLSWKRLTLCQVAIGAALGSYSHVVLDSVMHADIRPLAPFSEANPLLRVVSLDALHLACVASGVIGLGIVAIRKLLRDRP
jgi:membrane-bound metal-dependent hydrolase YbcI (DUF457 family)